MKTLRTLLGDHAGAFTTYQAWALAYGILRGLAMACLLGLIPALLATDWHRLGVWLAVTAVITALSLVAHYFQAMTVFPAAMSIQERLQEDLGDKVVSLPLGWFTTTRSAQLALLATKGATEVGQAAGHFLTPIISGSASSAVVMVAAWFVDWRVGLTLTCFAPLVWACHRWALALSDRSEEAKHAATGATSARVLEFARSQSLLRASGRSESYAPLDDAIEHARRVGKSHLWHEVASTFIGGVVVQAALGAGLSMAVVAVLGGADAGVALAAMALCIIAAQPLMLTFEYGSGLRQAMVQARRVMDILDTPSLPQPEQSAPRSAPGLVELNHVNFSYTPDRQVLRDVSFSVSPGTLTAVIGPSGCGKTTLTKLIARFYDVTSGSISVGGADVARQSTADLMAQLSLVFQDVYLFDDTLLANVRMGSPDAGDAEVESAAERAGVTEIVNRLPEGWQTRVGEGGSRLSGGERQRVSIARALLKNAPVVLLDEATAALDPENERHVTRSMDALRGSTRIVIAHKRETIRHADQIVVMNADGSVADIGQHEELLTRCQRYQAFWADREAASGWELARA